MFERWTRSWLLVKASARVLLLDRQLLVFPLISSLAAIVVAACFILPVFGLGMLDGLSEHGYDHQSPVLYSVGFLFYVCMYFVIFFFNAALVGAVMIRFDGGTPTVGDGLRIASSKIGTILGYAVIAATVGMILRIIQERVGFVGKIIAGLLGAGWTIATYLVVPVLVARDVGPFDAVKESATLLKQTWGENVVGRGGIGAAFFLVHLVLIACGLGIIFVAAMSGSVALIAIAAVVVVLAFMFSALVHAALSGIYSAALYRYAAGGAGSNGFDSEAMQMAFAPKKKK